MLTVVGGGLAGSEAAWQAASRGVPVTLYEMRPVARDRGPQDRPARRAGLQQLVPRRQAGQRRRPPQGGDAPPRLAGDARGRSEPRAGRRRAGRRSRAVRRPRSPRAIERPSARSRSSASEVTGDSRLEPSARRSSSRPGPLTSDALSADIARLVGAEHLYFYDAISPIVLAETIDRSKVFRQSRWDRSLRLASLSAIARAPARQPAVAGLRRRRRRRATI